MSGWKVCPEYRCDPGDKAFPARTDSSRSWHYLHSYRASLHRLSTGKLRSFTIPILSSVNRSEEHTSELQSLMPISYSVFCMKKQPTQLILNTHLLIRN